MRPSLYTLFSVVLLLSYSLVFLSLSLSFTLSWVSLWVLGLELLGLPTRSCFFASRAVNGHWRPRSSPLVHLPPYDAYFDRYAASYHSQRPTDFSVCTSATVRERNRGDLGSKIHSPLFLFVDERGFPARSNGSEKDDLALSKGKETLNRYSWNCDNSKVVGICNDFGILLNFTFAVSAKIQRT